MERANAAAGGLNAWSPRSRSLGASGPGLRRLHRGARERERLRLRDAAALLGLRRLLRRSGLRVGEDVVLRVSREQPNELVLVDRLALDEDPRDPVQVVHVLLEHAAGEVV